MKERVASFAFEDLLLRCTRIPRRPGFTESLSVDSVDAVDNTNKSILYIPKK